MRGLARLHPFLVALAPALFLYAHNIEQVALPDLIVPGLGSLLLAGLTLALFTLLMRSPDKAAILSSLFLILFFSYGHVYQALDPLHLTRRLHLILICLGVILFLVTSRKVRRAEGRLGRLASYLTALPVLLILQSLATIALSSRGGGELRWTPAIPASSQPTNGARSPLSTSGGPGALPNIWYFILDGYGRADRIREIFGLDNSPYVSFLEDRGFYVASRSRSNYTTTFLSLASSLNMQYVNDVAARISGASGDREFLYEMIRNNRVLHLAKARGYRYVHVNTTWSGTESNPNTDVAISYRPPWLQNEFLNIFVHTTFLTVFKKYLSFDLAEAHLYDFDRLAAAADMNGPILVFAHILLPHPPFLFERDGKIRRHLRDGEQPHGRDQWTSRKEYVDQVLFLDLRMEELIDRILSASRIPPIIVIQGDHGPAATRPDPSLPAEGQMTDVHLQERASILNAYYVPPACRRRLYDTITPVNSFRIILSEVFGEPLELLEDASYYSPHHSPYDLRRIDDSLNDRPAREEAPAKLPRRAHRREFAPR